MADSENHPNGDARGQELALAVAAAAGGGGSGGSGAGAGFPPAHNGRSVDPVASALVSVIVDSSFPAEKKIELLSNLYRFSSLQEHNAAEVEASKARMEDVRAAAEKEAEASEKRTALLAEAEIAIVNSFTSLQSPTPTNVEAGSSTTADAMGSDDDDDVEISWPPIDLPPAAVSSPTRNRQTNDSTAAAMEQPSDAYGWIELYLKTYADPKEALVRLLKKDHKHYTYRPTLLPPTPISIKHQILDTKKDYTSEALCKRLTSSFKVIAYTSIKKEKGVPGFTTIHAWWDVFRHSTKRAWLQPGSKGDPEYKNYVASLKPTPAASTQQPSSSVVDPSAFAP
jgi:hypothetical protein